MIYSQEEIEKLFIGSIIADPVNIVYAVDIVGTTDLTTEQARTSFRVILEMFKAKKEINLQAFLLEPELKNYFEWLVDADDHGIKSNCVMLANDISEKARQRRLADGIKKLARMPITSSEETLSDIKNLYSSELTGDKDSGDMRSGINELDGQIEENIKTGSLGIRTGFDIFDQLDIEYERGHCWAAGGATSVGKTALMIEQICRLLTIYDKVPLMAVHSTEMKKFQIIARLLAGMTGIGHKLILRGKADPSIDAAKARLLQSGLKIYDVNRDFDVFCNQCRKDKMQGGLDIVWADYLQNFKRKGVRGYEMMAEMGKDSLALPQELDMTLIMFSQIALSEIKEDSGGLAFKGAGELGESCDLGFWLSKCKTREYTMMVEHRKNRHGSKRDFLLEFQPHSNRLNEL